MPPRVGKLGGGTGSQYGAVFRPETPAAALLGETTQNILGAKNVSQRFARLIRKRLGDCAQDQKTLAFHRYMARPRLARLTGNSTAGRQLVSGLLADRNVWLAS